MTPNRLAWEQKANEVTAKLAAETTSARIRKGTAIRDLLLTYGAFYERLTSERDRDASAAATKTTGADFFTGVRASLLVGGLLVSAIDAGLAGNNITVTVSPGVGANFEVLAVDPDASAAQLVAAIGALNGAPPPTADDPTLSQLLADAQTFLDGLDDATRSEAEATLRAEWPDYREARTGLVIPRQEQALDAAIEAACSGNPDAATDANATRASYAAAQTAALASIVTLTVSRDTTSETFAELVPMQNGIEGSALVHSEWLAAVRPPDGTYQLSGGLDASGPNVSGASAKPSNDYTLTLDDHRTFTLAELESIVTIAMNDADVWLGSTA